MRKIAFVFAAFLSCTVLIMNLACTQRGKSGSTKKSKEIETQQEGARGKALPQSKIAYVKNQNELWLMNADGRDKKELAQIEKGAITDIAFSPDGQRIVFVTGINFLESGERIVTYLYGIDLRNMKLRELSKNLERYCTREPRFSPDGNSVFFMEDRREGVYLMNVGFDGGQKHCVYGKVVEPYYALSQDGKKISFVLDLPPDSRTGWDKLVMMNTDGSQEVTTDVKLGLRPLLFSLDNTKLFVQDGNQISGFDLNSINELSNFKFYGDFYFHGLSSDGSMVVWEVCPIAETEAHFEVVELTSRGFKFKGKFDLSNFAPPKYRSEVLGYIRRGMFGISPDGRRIAYASSQSGNQDIYVFDISTAKFERLTDDSASEIYPVWSPK